VVGTPTRQEIEAMNPNYTEFKFPQVAFAFVTGFAAAACLLDSLTQQQPACLTHSGNRPS